MIQNDPTKVDCTAFKRLAVVVMITCLFSLGICSAEQYSSSDGYAVLLEESPAGAGYVSPDVGIHEHGQNDVMDLRATPKPGYRFLYWLGDVEESTENETTVTVDSPKIVVAVFSRVPQYAGSTSLTPGPGIGGLRPNYVPSGGGGSAPTYPDPIDPKKPPKEPPVPEPATIALLGIGSLITLRRKK